MGVAWAALQRSKVRQAPVPDIGVRPESGPSILELAKIGIRPISDVRKVCLPSTFLAER